jgi:hypothetical protein
MNRNKLRARAKVMKILSSPAARFFSTSFIFRVLEKIVFRLPPTHQKAFREQLYFKEML